MLTDNINEAQVLLFIVNVSL